MDEEPSMIPPEQAHTPEPARSGVGTRVLGVAVGIALIAGSAALGYVVHDMIGPRTPGQQTPIPQPQTTPVSVTTGSSSATTTIDHVQWHDPQLVDAGFVQNRPQPAHEGDYVPQVDEYIVGTVSDGPYAGGRVHLLLVLPEGLGGLEAYHFIELNGRYTNVDHFGTKDLTERWSLGEPQPTEYTDFEFAPQEQAKGPVVFADLQMPETIMSPDGRLVLDSTTTWGAMLFSAKGPNEQRLTKVFTHPKYGDVYSNSGDGGFTVRTPDGLVATYVERIPFMKSRDYNVKNVPLITWNDTKQLNDKSYFSWFASGCGPGNYADVVSPSEIDVAKDLVPVATYTADNGQQFSVLGYKDPNHKDLKSLYEDIASNYSYYANGKKLPYQDFLKLRPVFFWQDPIGRLIRFTNAEYPSPAECGKPVIYLYPQQPTRVSVQVRPNGGFSKTEPPYGTSGWRVLAQPDGQLTDLVDGTTWPYLYWEGQGNSVGAREDRGFVVRRADIPSFLEDKLAKLGLSAKERADFEEFWVPRMSTSPYYFVTFYDNKLMDSIAPLTVSPRPDTVIRILMDYRPLAQPITVAPLPIRTPERTGFTVVEWGGVLHK